MANRVQNPFLNQTNTANKRQGSGFTNLQRILGANRRSRLGEAVQGGFSRLTEQARGRLGESEEKFSEQAEKNRLDTQKNVDFRKQALEDIGGGKDATEEQVSQFAKFRAGNYTGPRQLGNVSELNSQAQDIKQLGRAGRDPSSRLGLLRRFAGGSQYTLGQQRLDQLLLGQQGDMMKGMRKQATGFGRELNERASIAEQRGQELANLGKQFAEGTREQIQETRDPIETASLEKFEQAKKSEEQRQQDAQTFQKYLRGEVNPSLAKDDQFWQGLDFARNKGLITDAERANLIATQNQAQRHGQSAADTILSQIQDIGPQNLTQAAFASEDERAKLNALAQLGGTDPFSQGDVGEYQAGRIKTGSLDPLTQRLDELDIDEWEKQTGSIHPSRFRG